MTQANNQPPLPPRVAEIKRHGYVTWASDQLSAEFKSRFDESRIPVIGIRHVRQWGIQVDDERELPGLERTSIADEELWEVVLKAKDGSSYEVNHTLLEPVPE